MNRIPCYLVFAFLLSYPATPLHAQFKGKGPAFTEPPKDDVSFQLMGEFVGPIKSGENEYKPIALQIRHIGSDNFEAVSFNGGLPGQPKHEPKMTPMIGRRSGEVVILSGGPWAIFVKKDHCLIVDPNGQMLGRLERIERQSPTLGAMPPKGAVIIFDGKNVDQFTTGKMTKDGLLMEGADLKPMFQDFNLHAEFRIPYMPLAQGQQRGNSGLYLQSRYECQVLDSFALDRLVNGLGALYQQKKPDLNMALPPLVWQTYDVQFTAPRWAADGSKIRNAHITSWINGVKVQDNVSVKNKTGAGKPEEPTLLPIRLQNHGDPVRFRNIWIVDRGISGATQFPVLAPKPAPPKPEPKKLEPPKPEPKKPEPPKPEPKKPEPPKPEPKKPEPPKPEPKKPEPPKPEPKKPEAPKPEPKKPEPPKPDSSADQAQADTAKDA